MYITSVVRGKVSNNGEGINSAVRDNYSQGIMNTDIKETEQAYEFLISLPGIKKENIHMQLKDGYLSVGADTENKTEECADNGKYIRRERFSGKAVRTFYVGEDVKEEDIHPRFDKGTLYFKIPKKDQVVEDRHQYISIE